MIELTLHHRGKRGPQALPTANGEYIELLPGQTKTAMFQDEYAELLKHRSANNDVVEVVGVGRPRGGGDDAGDDADDHPLHAVSMSQPRKIVT